MSTEIERTSGTMKAATRENINSRLLKIQGQMRGIRNMIGQERPCEETLAQISAVRAALRRVGDAMVADHVERWLTQSALRPEGVPGDEVEKLLKSVGRYLN